MNDRRSNPDRSGNASDGNGPGRPDTEQTDVVLPGEDDDTVPAGVLVFDPIRAIVAGGALLGAILGGGVGIALGPPVAGVLLSVVGLVGGGVLGGLGYARVDGD